MSGTGIPPPVVPPLTDDEKVEIRRYLGVEVFGSGPTIDPFGRTFSIYPELEYRLNNMQPAELTMIRTRIAAIAQVETDLEAATGNLDTASAAVWTHNPNEVRDRTALLTLLCRRLASTLGMRGAGLQSGNTATLIV